MLTTMRKEETLFVVFYGSSCIRFFCITMSRNLMVVALALLLCAAVQAFMAPKFGGAIVRDSALNACRRNNKMEKRRRNRDYARKFQGTGGSRKDVVIEEKRAVVASNEEKFQAQVFKMTTDDDMPAYSGFEWS